MDMCVIVLYYMCCDNIVLFVWGISMCGGSHDDTAQYDECCLLQPLEVFIDDDTKLTLHGLQQHYVKLQDREKNRKLFDLLDVLEFNQVMDV